MRVTFLGTGTSRGVPVIGCPCPTCTSPDPRNRRLRSSVLLQKGDTTVVIDTSVDFRLQMLRYGVKRLDAVVYTHSHVDHIMGLDDVYPFNIWSKSAMPIYGHPETLLEIQQTFRHLFSDDPYPGIPHVELCPIQEKFQIGELHFEPLPVFHGSLPIYGYRVGEFAYLTDVSRIPDESMEKLKGLRYLVLDGLRLRPHPTHFSVQEAVQVAREIAAQHTYLIHMCHDVEHGEISSQLPGGIRLSYDGLVLEW